MIQILLLKEKQINIKSTKSFVIYFCWKQKIGINQVNIYLMLEKVVQFMTILF